jgi:hypothetical protein
MTSLASASLAGSFPLVRSGEFENLPHLQGGFEKPKSKKKMLTVT